MLEKWTRRQKNSWKSFAKWFKYLNNLRIHLVVTTMIFQTSKDWKQTNKQQDLSALHLNISSISAHIDDLRILSKHPQKKLLKLYGPFLWMGFNCPRARATSRRQFTNTDLPGFNMEQTPNESSADLYLPKQRRYTALKNWNLHLLSY